MSCKESDQPLEQLKQVVFPSHQGINGAFEKFPILLCFGEPVCSKAIPPPPAAKPEPPLPAPTLRCGDVAAGTALRGNLPPDTRRPFPCPPRRPWSRRWRQGHNRNKSPNASPPTTAGVIKKPTNNACVLVRGLGSHH